MRTEDFFSYCRKRYEIKLQREAGKPKPWTKDTILQTYRFCNVFREDDKVTKWIRSNITYAQYGEKLLGAMTIARWFNKIETLQLLQKFGLFDFTQPDWKDKVKTLLKNEQPIFTAAYIIRSPEGLSKLDGILWCMEQCLPHSIKDQEKMRGYSLQTATELLKQYPYIGAFIAYEIVTDMRHTPVLGFAPDIMTWANPGGGCARGLSRMLDLPTNHFNRHKKEDIEEMLAYMNHILPFSKSSEFWPQHWPFWEMREVEHNLCEFDKYERARTGQGKPKQLYKGV